MWHRIIIITRIDARQRGAKSLIRSKLEGDGTRVAVAFRDDLSAPTATLSLRLDTYARNDEDGWTSVMRRENKKLYYDFRT